MNVLEETGVKRYVLRFRARPWEPWEYPPDLQFDTLEDAQAALCRTYRPGWELAERAVAVRYSAEGKCIPDPLLDRMLRLGGMRPYVLQKRDGRGWWDGCMGMQFSTEEAAQRAAKEGPYRVAAATLVEWYEPVRESARSWTADA